MEKTISNNYIKAGAGIIIVKDGKTLLAKRKKKTLGDGHWGSSGGHVEIGETPAQAAIREAKEELGIEVGNLQFLICIDEQWLDGKQYIDIIFLADIISGEPKNMEPEKIEAVGWFPVNDLPEPMFPPVKLALQAIKTGKKYDEFKE